MKLRFIWVLLIAVSAGGSSCASGLEESAGAAAALQGGAGPGSGASVASSTDGAGGAAGSASSAVSSSVASSTASAGGSPCADEEACTYCLKQDCDPDFTMCLAVTDCQAVLTCFFQCPCGDTPCFDACHAAQPGGQLDYADLAGCAAQSACPWCAPVP